jgi:hypothetical protein
MSDYYKGMAIATPLCRAERGLSVSPDAAGRRGACRTDLQNLAQSQP